MCTKESDSKIRTGEKTEDTTRTQMESGEPPLHLPAPQTIVSFLL